MALAASAGPPFPRASSTTAASSNAVANASTARTVPSRDAGCLPGRAGLVSLGPSGLSVSSDTGDPKKVYALPSAFDSTLSRGGSDGCCEGNAGTVPGAADRRDYSLTVLPHALYVDIQVESCLLHPQNVSYSMQRTRLTKLGSALLAGCNLHHAKTCDIAHDRRVVSWRRPVIMCRQTNGARDAALSTFDCAIHGAAPDPASAGGRRGRERGVGEARPRAGRRGLAGRSRRASVLLDSGPRPARGRRRLLVVRPTPKVSPMLADEPGGEAAPASPAPARPGC